MVLSAEKNTQLHFGSVNVAAVSGVKATCTFFVKKKKTQVKALFGVTTGTSNSIRGPVCKAKVLPLTVTFL